MYLKIVGTVKYNKGLKDVVFIQILSRFYMHFYFEFLLYQNVCIFCFLTASLAIFFSEKTANFFFIPLFLIAYFFIFVNGGGN